MNSLTDILFNRDRLSEVWANITHNKRRSLLTAFGVFWGVFMLVVMLSFGKGIENGIFSQIDSIPRNSSICWTDKTNVPFAGFRKGRWWEITSDDMTAISDAIPEIEMICPQVSGRTVAVVNREKSASYTIKGVDGNLVHIGSIVLLEGRYINEMDVIQCRKVCVLGKKIVDEVYKGVSPVGKYVKVGGVSYQCIGIVDKSSDNMNIGGPDNETVALPYTLVQRIYNLGDEIHVLVIVARDGIPIASVEDRVRNILYQRHRISPDDRKAMMFINVDEVVQQFVVLTLGINVLIWIIGLGTLLSGAIGVSNIVLISVKARTREIGVRRAIGARPRDIIAQILTESVIITSLAGLCGLVCGVGLMLLLGDSLMLGSSDGLELVRPILSFKVAVSATAVIIASGLLAGLLPASRAMKITAIDAIREE